MPLAPEFGIVLFPLDWVCESLHCLLQLLELNGGRFDVLRVLVRVCGKGEAAELFFNSVLGGVGCQAQDIVKGAGVCHHIGLRQRTLYIISLVVLGKSVMFS